MINKQNKKYSSGFTLIELMIVVAIIAVLTTISYPMYNSQIQKARRSEGRNSLLDFSMRFEEFYGTNYTYTGADVYTNLSTKPKTENNYYQMSGVISSAGDTYTLTATAINSQAKDTDCATITFDQVGTKSPTTCW
jgi:type IV pilus assembly protein PilE